MSQGTQKKLRMAELTRSAERQQPDRIIADIARFATEGTIVSEEAYRTARYCLMDSLGCGLLALRFPACTRLLGPVVPGASMSGGARVPGTGYEFDPVRAAFNIGCMIRWLDYNDTWLAVEWGHPSDNFGAILAVADYRSRMGDKVTLREILTAAVKAYEIQGVLALDNSFNRLGLDHVILVRVASTAVATAMLGGSIETVFNALTQAFLDGGALRTYRHAPNTGSRKSWAAADATSRAVWLALISTNGEMGYPTALSAPVWGFTDSVRRGEALTLSRKLGSYVMENVLFKVVFPAEFHAQTGVEAAVSLHPEVSARLDQVERIVIETQEAAMRIIDKVGRLDNPADRDHCLQYITAIGLIYGELTAAHYEDVVAADPRIDVLREKMEVKENQQFSKDYLDPAKRSIANAVEVIYDDGSTSGRVEVAYPVGHRRRREEAIPLLKKKFVDSLRTHFAEDRVTAILQLFDDPECLDATPVDEFMDLFVKKTRG